MNNQPEPSRCSNKYCSNAGHLPATGMEGLAANCSSVQSMIRERNAVGGVPTGRGVVPCPLGYYQRGENTPLEMSPAGSNFNQIFFQPNDKPWVPQPHSVRSLIRIGNVYRNGA
jgi:hypothetical protein